jgi:hypothetical protein
MHNFEHGSPYQLIQLHKLVSLAGVPELTHVWYCRDMWSKTLSITFPPSSFRLMELVTAWKFFFFIIIIIVQSEKFFTIMCNWTPVFCSHASQVRQQLLKWHYLSLNMSWGKNQNHQTRSYYGDHSNDGKIMKVWTAQDRNLKDAYISL